MADNYKGTNIPKSYDPEQEAARQARIAAATAAENATLTPEQKARRRQMAGEVMDRIREDSFADQAPIYLEGGVPLDSVMNLVRPNGQPATQPAATDTPATQPAVPEQVQPAPAQGSPYTRIGNETRTVYGSKVRYVDQRPGMGGAVRWAEIDANGNETAKDANGNPIMPSSQAQAERGGLSDDPDIARWRGQAQYNRMKADERKKAKGARDNLLAETVAQMGELFQSYGEIRKSKDGRLYRVYMERNGDGDNPVSRLNKMNIDMGRGGNLTSIAIAQEVDADGNPVGKPVIKYGIAQDGGKKATAIRNLDIGTVMNRWADTYAAANGISQLEGRRRAVERFGGSEQVFGRNPNNWDIALTAQEVEAAKQKQLDAQNALAKSKIDNQNAQFYASLGLDEKKLRQNQEQFDKNYDLAERQFAAAEGHADKADSLAERKVDLAERQFDEQVKQTIRGADREDMKLAYEIVTGLQAAGKGMTTGDILRGLGDKAIEQFYKVPVVDENGKPVLDVEGKQATRPPQTEAEYQQCTDALVKAVNALRGEGSGSSIRDKYAQFQQTRAAIAGGNAAPAAPAQGATTQEPDKDITLPDGRAGRVHNGKTYVQSGTDANGNPQWNPVETSAATPAQGGAGSSYGLRNDGKTYKGTGWLGELRLPDGGVATEYTMQSDAVRDANGNRIDFPTLVPTLTKAEQDLMVNDIIPNGKPVPDEIAQKAVDFARMRLANGQSVFANDGQPSAQGGAASNPVGDMAQPVGKLGAATPTPTSPAPTIAPTGAPSAAQGQDEKYTVNGTLPKLPEGYSYRSDDEHDGEVLVFDPNGKQVGNIVDGAVYTFDGAADGGKGKFTRVKTSNLPSWLASQSPAATPPPTEGEGPAAAVTASEKLRKKNTSQGAKEERESATPEDLWGGDVMERFRRNHPEATDEDIRGGKFDNVLEKIGSALHGDGYRSKNASLKDKESRLRAAEEQAARNYAEAEKRQKHIAAMDEQRRGIAEKAQNLFGDAWKQADDWAIEHHGEGVFFKDSYETARAKKFAELVKDKAKKDGIQLYNIYKLAQNVFGDYDVGSVFDVVFGKGAGTYFGRPRSGAPNIFSNSKNGGKK